MAEGNISDYIGRVADVSLFQGVNVGLNNPLDLELAATGESGQLITGAAKLAQRFFLEFMTERGTILGRPDRGSVFMTYVRQGKLRTTAEVEQAFYFAVNQIVDNLTSEEADDIPDDEAFSYISLYSVNLADQELSIKIAVNSVAGTSRKVILPISTRIR